ncbi:MAG: succinate dehydrogenase cytochrome b subunit [Microthrixaceae bacterium]
MTQAIERPGADAPVVNKPKRPGRPWPVEFATSAVGLKWIMALSGIALIGFVLAHAFGNLKVYFGAEDFDYYAESLRTLLYPFMPETWVLWAMRIGLIVAFAAHIGSAVALTRMNKMARPTRYQSPRHYIAANFASRSMRWTGIIVALFLLWHLADLTWGWVNPDFVRGDVYDNLVASLDRLPVAIFYILANIALGIHLFHGSWSMFQSMGINSPRYNAIRRWVAGAIAVSITLVNVSIPLAVTVGIVG